MNQNNTLYEVIKSLRPCKIGLVYASRQSTAEEIIKNVRFGDWLLWLAHKLDIDKRIITKSKIECARYMVSLISNPDIDEPGYNSINQSKRIIKECLDIGEKYCNCDATQSQMDEAVKRIYNRFPKSSGYLSVGGHLCIPAYFALSQNTEICCTSISTTIANHKSAFFKIGEDAYDEVIDNIEARCLEIVRRHLGDIIQESLYHKLTSIGYER